MANMVAGGIMGGYLPDDAGQQIFGSPDGAAREGSAGGRMCLITGSASGVGRAASLPLANEVVLLPCTADRQQLELAARAF